MWFSSDNLVLTVAQAACVVLPAAGLPAALQRVRGGAWALVLPLSIAVVVGAIAVIPTTADVLTWVALLLVPPGCALALGWAMRGARPPLAVLAAPLLAVAWTRQDTTAGELATIVLIAGSAITLGRLLAGGVPLVLLRAGVVAMAVVDAVLVFSGSLQQPNAVLVAAVPAPGLPQLQSAGFHGAGLGYGDFFAAAVVGGVLAAEGLSWRGALAAGAGLLVVSLAWDQLFLVYDVLPATIPPAVVLLAAEAWRGDLRLRPRGGGGGAQGPQGRLRPRQLVEHRPRGLLADVVGVQLPVLAEERGHERQVDRLGHGAQAQRGGDGLERDDGPRAGGDAAVGDEPQRLVAPLVVQEVQRVLQGRGIGVVVLGGDEDEGVRRIHPRAPAAGVVAGVAAQAGVVGLVVEREGQVGEVDDLDVEGPDVAGAGGEPTADGPAHAAGAGGGDDDEQAGHVRPCCPGQAAAMRSGRAARP